jgi:hypothetical protein
MANHYERRKKIRHEPSDANVDEGGSSHAHVVSGRNLRLRGQKRAPVDDGIEEENVSESSIRPGATGLRTWHEYSRIRDGACPIPCTYCKLLGHE